MEENDPLCYYPCQEIITMLAQSAGKIVLLDPLILVLTVLSLPMTEVVVMLSGKILSVSKTTFETVKSMELR
jgi:hypothetical protein